MKMLMMIYKESLEEDVKALLARHEVKAFTEMNELTGMGEGGATLDSLSWPGFNNLVMAAMPDTEADKVIHALKAYREELAKKQGNNKIPLRVFSMPCDLV